MTIADRYLIALITPQPVSFTVPDLGSGIGVPHLMANHRRLTAIILKAACAAGTVAVTAGSSGLAAAQVCVVSFSLLIASSHDRPISIVPLVSLSSHDPLIVLQHQGRLQHMLRARVHVPRASLSRNLGSPALSCERIA